MRAVWHICTSPGRGNADPVGGRVWSVHRTAAAERPGWLEQSWQEWEWAPCSERRQRISCGAGEASVRIWLLLWEKWKPLVSLWAEWQHNMTWEFFKIYWSIIDFQCCVNFCYTAKWSAIHIYMYIFAHTFFFMFFSIMIYYRMLNIVPCALQEDLVVHPSYM